MSLETAIAVERERSMAGNEQNTVPSTTAEARTTRRVNRATLALLALLIATGLARQFGLLDPILVYGVGGGLVVCLLIVQLDRLHARRAPGDEDTQA
ncbi:MAG: hypothetical protein ACTHMA_13225 [Thermomicrobiales bacterium]